MRSLKTQFPENHKGAALLRPPMSWFSPGPRKRGPASKVSRVGRRLLRRTRNTSKALGLHRDLMRHWITSFQLLNRNPTSQRFAKSGRSEEHTSELQSLMRISYAVFCLKKKKKKQNYNL